MGGYRSYRPHIIRYDTIMPITISLILFFGASTVYIFNNIPTKQKTWYVPLILGVLFIYCYADKPEFDNNKCERISLQKIADSKSSIVEVEENCNVVNWGKMLKPEDSELNAQLFCIWRITERKKLYYNK